jgi:hypothetical protein
MIQTREKLYTIRFFGLKESSPVSHYVFTVDQEARIEAGPYSGTIGSYLARCKIDSRGLIAPCLIGGE